MDKSIDSLKADIEFKVKKLKERCNRLEKENATQRESIFNYLQTIDTLKATLHENKNVTVAAKLNMAEHTAHKKMLDQYIKLIDIAIAKIQQQD
jgi:hypothetical protein